MKLTLLQSAVRSINDLRIVETLDEFKANIGKRRNVYATNIDETYVDHPATCIDHVPNSPYEGIDLPPDDFYQVHALSSSV